MTATPPPNPPADDRPADLIEAYLDGLLTDEQRRRFEQHLAGDARLRAELDRQRRIDESLRRQFQPPQHWQLDRQRLFAAHNGTAAATSHASADAARPRTFPLRPVAAVAAALVLIATGIWLTVNALRSPGSGSGYDHAAYLPSTPRTMHEVYDRTQNLNFEADWLCETSAEFTDAFRERFGRPLALKGDLGGTGVVGMSYSYTLTPRTMAVLFKIDDVELIVFADRIEADHPPQLTDDSDLHVHRREVGGYVLYEVSPRDRPIALDLFIVP